MIKTNHKFDLSHLTQKENEAVGGPIQDSEALLLYALIKVTLARRVVEVGGLNGYSAKNFLQAVGQEGTVFTIDIRPVAKIAPNHFIIKGAAGLIDPNEFGTEPVDLVFFDCHAFPQQLKLLEKMEGAGLVDENTILAMHDTNPHPNKTCKHAYENTKGEWIHQKAERDMVNTLQKKGWQALCLHTLPGRHSKKLPFRHGLTLMKKFSTLVNEPKPAQ